MTKTELIAAARTVLDDTVTPYLWSDTELGGYAEDAEQEATERAHLLEVDGVDAYCKITLASGTSSYSTQALVYEILRARVAGQSNYLIRKSREWLDQNWPLWEDATGIPSHYYFTGSLIRLVPNPTAIANLNMVVRRLPVTMGTSPEIHARHHRRMLDWVYHRAYSKRDPDTFNPAKALDYKNMFEESFGKRWNATEQNRRLKHTPVEMQDTYGS